MNIKYYHEFVGVDGIAYRFEILTNNAVSPLKIEAVSSPFILEYPEIKKLEAIQSSGAKIGLISDSIFQFIDLHTDDMQAYLVRFYRGGVLCWLGWLDSELYTENLSAVPPYEVEFSGSDFNILERLKYKQTSGAKYLDIVNLITCLQRCFSLLSIPFEKLYIGCSTSAEGIAQAASETILHKLFIQSSNFYDEDGEPMDCREVIESILEPFGLSIVQRNGSVFIYDYNTIKSGGVMKCYNFSTLDYVGDTLVDVEFGDMYAAGFASTDSSLSFEEMINNVEITSSPYIELPFVEKKLEKSSFAAENITATVDDPDYTKTTYSEATGWSWNNFVLFQAKKQDSSVIGAKITYYGLPVNNSAAWVIPNKVLEFNMTSDYIAGSDAGYQLNIKLDAYFNGKANLFDEDEKPDDSESTRMGIIKCNLYLVDNAGTIIKYYSSIADELGNQHHEWKTKSGDEMSEQGAFRLVYAEKNIRNSRLLNKWNTNSNFDQPSNIATFYGTIDDNNLGAGANIPLPTGISGFIRLELLDHIKLYSPYDPTSAAYEVAKIKDLLINNLAVSIVDKNGNDVSSLDYEFKSYINKNVSSDYEKKELKVVSCNEDLLPVGKGNLLKMVDSHYEFQLNYLRANQTAILERLLMCSIHSNYTKKNKMIEVDVLSTDTPIIKKCTYTGVGFSSDMLIIGCNIDYQKGVAKLNVVDFSEDVESLSDIPYNE
nr:hypothetical protein [uncultured Macellibacteroides sp.]